MGKNGNERIHQTLLNVDVTTNQRMSELHVSVDHSNACFYVNFYLPTNFSDVEVARQTTYFLVYYKSDGSAPLNSIPFNNAKCSAPFLISTQNSKLRTSNIRCALSCCANNNNFEAAADYVFQVSMVLSRENSIITPLSEPAYATSWDSCMIFKNILFIFDLLN